MAARAPRATITSTPRPRDRKEQIISSAGSLFYRHGFHNVGTEEIAQSVGITAGALYRHFKGKQDLLAHTLIDVFEHSTAVVLETSHTSLEAMVEGLAETAGARRDLGVLWNRESRHLDDERRSTMRGRFFAFVAEFTRQLRVARPELAEADAELLTWSTLGVLTSVSYHRAEMDQESMTRLLFKLAMVVCTTTLSSEVREPDAKERHTGLAPHGRRESILVAATRLFYAHGYRAVSMDDVGAAVGMTNAGVYKYFTSKAELLSAVIARASEPLQLGLNAALAAATTSEEGLSNVLDAYIEFAAEHHDLVGILVSEVTNLPEDQRHSVRRAQHDYVVEWVGLIRSARPELSSRNTRFLVHAVLTVVNDVTRTRSLLARPGIKDELRLLCRRLLDAEI